MRSPSPVVWLLTVVNVAAAITALLCTGYVVGLMEGHQYGTSNGLGIAGQGNREYMPKAQHPGVHPNPKVGHGHHPVFDCSAMVGHIKPDGKGGVALDTLTANRGKYEGKSVSVRGRVMQAFPQIMGLNWIHICDKANGDVLVISTKRWVEPGHEVIARGTIAYNHDVAGAYRFPLFMSEAQLEGQAVRKGWGPDQGAVYDL